ncbi:MAG: hypothetical protein JWO53_1278, partial [Chlamydiia bacterium]|nr:hypothetical protein [Chlamydiia bacterium]
ISVFSVVKKFKKAPTLYCELAFILTQSAKSKNSYGIIFYHREHRDHREDPVTHIGNT